MKFSIVLLIIEIQKLFTLCSSLSDIRAVQLKCEYLNNPLAVDSPNPRLSWNFEATDPKKQNLTQKSYQILVATTPEKLSLNTGDLWDSKVVLSDRNTHIRYNGVKLAAGQRAYWAVKVWDQNNVESTQSSIAFWDNGYGINDWTAEWIGAPAGTQHKALENISDIDAKVIHSHSGVPHMPLSPLVPVLYLRKLFSTDSKIKFAKLYSTAQGAYKALINGHLISDAELSPGWTDYNKTIQYQTYDVTKFIEKENTLGVILGTGWFSGFVGFGHRGFYYGLDQNFLMELHIEYNDKRKIVIKSDNSWRTTTGPLIYSDFLMGELYYEDRELDGWTQVSYDDKHWLSVVTKPVDKKVELLADKAQPVRVTQELKPKTRWQSSPGVWVFDFEQNFVGWVRIRFSGQSKAARVQLRHAEVLNPDGSVYTKNLRAALATDTYVLKNNNRTDDLILEPHFTFHGFRYLEISGYPGEPQLDDVVGRVVGSDIPFVGKLETSSKMVNKLHQNIIWGQRGNFLSVPTDCPQRDERLGWMGDGEVFAQTAAYNADVSAFYTKWLRDVRGAQSKEGGFSDVSPRIADNLDGAPAWGDAGVIVPFNVYRMYGDVQVIEDGFESMKKWIDFILSANPDLIWTNRVNKNHGDWLSVNASTPKEVLSTGYFAYDALLLSRMADIINRTEDANKYRKLHSDIANAFRVHFVNKTDGKILGDTQTCYLVGLAFELLTPELIPKAVSHLVENVKAHDWHLTTGFVGVGFLTSILTQYGHNDVAYRLLLQETYPSWGYSIKYNATTIWERWDGWTKENGFQNPSMNSFNHYSLGSVGRWLFQSVAGIDTDEHEVGFKKIIIKPNPGEGLSFVDSEYGSINGLIKSSWNLTKEDFKLKVSIPVNTRALIDLRFSKNGSIHEVGSGAYDFSVSMG